MAKKQNTDNAIESIDLALRFKNDGGPVFQFLSEHRNSHVRGERVRQLLYLGLLREKELTGSASFATAPIRPEGLEPEKGSNGPAVMGVEKQNPADETGDLKIPADDLDQIFGMAS